MQMVQIRIPRSVHCHVGVCFVLLCRYLEPSTSLGVIVGTGTNACYVEQQSKLTKWQASAGESKGDGQTAINIEWGAFYSDHLPRCAEDDDVDQATSHGGKLY